MKTTPYLSALFLFVSTSVLCASAQVEEDSVINRNITIEREYQPVIQDAGKINTLPNFVEPKVSKITPQYTTNFSKPLSVEHNIHYLSSADLAYERPKNKEGFARLGIGTGFNSLADFAYPLLKKPDMKLDFILNHYGLFNKKAHSTTQAALAFDKKFQAVDFFTGISGSHEYFKYYGNIFGRNDSIITDPTSIINPSSVLLKQNTLWRFNAHAGVRTSPTTDELRYGILLNYDLFDSQQGITEQLLRLDANMDGEVAGNRLGVNLSSQNQFYNTVVNNNGWVLTAENYYVLSVNPYYSFEKEAFDLRIGFKSFFSFANGRIFSPSPDVHFEWRAVPQFLSIYAGAGGEYQINTLNNIHKENCFLSPTVTVADTYTPVDFYLGAKVKPITGLLLDAFIDYQIISDQYFFINQGDIGLNNVPFYSNQFDVVYSKANVLKAGGRISYNYQNKFSIHFSGAYNHWNVKNLNHAWHKPAFEADFSASALVTKKLNVYANMNLAGKRWAKTGDMAVELSPKVDINLGASYAWFDWLSLFMKVNNLINNRYEQWHGYEVQGFNIMAGAAFNF